MKYKVGDKVVIRAWDDMAKQFGFNARGDIKAHFCFTKEMRQYCGKTMTITGLCWGGYSLSGADNFLFDEDMFEKSHFKKIVITTDGTETLARLYEGGKVVKSATAKCSPEDEFDFSSGAKLAFDRLMTSERWRVVNRPARVGDYVRLTEASFSFNEVGDILIVAEILGGDCISVKACDHPRDTRKQAKFLWHYTESEYEVVEPCGEEKKEEYYNGRVVCVESPEQYAYTVGKIYEFKNGMLVNDNGIRYPYEPIKTLDEWNRQCRHSIFAKFIALVE